MVEEKFKKEEKLSREERRKKRSSRKVVKGKFMLIESVIPTEYYRKTLEIWPKLIKNKKKIVFFPCASTKPIQTSRTHCFLSPLTRKYQDDVLLAIVSEPLIIIPYLDDKYPNYDYKPEMLRKNKKEYNLFVKRLSEFRKRTPEDVQIYYIGGKHHLEILEKAGFKPIAVIPQGGIKSYNSAAKILANDIFGKDAITFKIKTKQISPEIVELRPIIPKQFKEKSGALKKEYELLKN